MLETIKVLAQLFCVGFLFMVIYCCLLYGAIAFTASPLIGGGICLFGVVSLLLFLAFAVDEV